MPTIINTKLSESRGKSRVWMEGDKLAREGVVIGSRYNVEFSNSGVILRLGDEGKFVVSRRKARTEKQVDKPLIEFKDHRLLDLFSETPELRVTIHGNRITITARCDYTKRRSRVDRIVSKIDQGQALDVVSLFHGGGVLDAAIHDGLNISGVDSRLAVCVEKESAYLDSSIRNNAHLFDENTIVIQSMLEKVNFEKSGSAFDCLYAGLPCIDHSVSGKAKKRDQLKGIAERGSSGAMFHYLLKMVEKINCGIVLIECVEPFSSSASAAVLRTVLEDMGYCLQERIFYGNEFGALENRKRWVLIAIDFNLVNLTGFDIESVKTLNEKPRNFGEVMEDLSLDDPRWKKYQYLADKEKRDKAAGKGFMRQFASGESERVPCITRQYNKVRSTDVQIRHPDNPELSRLLTVKEHALCKGVNESIVAGNSVTIGHEILGQSVVWGVFLAIGYSLGVSLKAFFCENSNTLVA